MTSNPITGGGAKRNLLAAWGSIVLRGRSEAEAIEYLNHDRPSNDTIVAKHATELAPVKLFRITEIAESRDDAFQRFFAKGGVYEKIAETTAGGGGAAH